VWEKVPGAEYYQIYKSDAEDGTYAKAGDPIAPVFGSGTAAGLEGNTAYWFKVAAGNAAGESAMSEAVSASTAASPIALPAAPANFHVTAQAATSISFQWDNVDNISGYKIYSSEHVGGPFEPEADNLTTTSTAITGLIPNQDYYFKIAAKNAVGESRGSDTLMAATTPRITQIVSNSSYNYSYYPSVAVDGNGTIHVVYNWDYNHKLYYATYVGGTWTASVEIDGVQAGMPSLRIDGAGKLHVAYWDMSSGYLKYATNTSGSWTTLVVDNEGSLGAGAALTLDGDGKVHISYHDYDNDNDDSNNGDNHNFVKYATNKNGTWEPEIVVRSVQRYNGNNNVSTAIGVSSEGTIYIAYSCWNNANSNSELYGVSKSPGALWGVPDKILYQGQPYWYPMVYRNLDMKMFNDTPYFIYSQERNLGLVFRERGVWKAGILDANCYFSDSSYDQSDLYQMRPSLAIDSNGALYVSYQAHLDNGRYSLKYGTNAGRAWRFRTPVLNKNNDVVGRWSGIGVDATGKVHIAYMNYNTTSPNNTLNYLTW
jgi:hypothetical protein